MICWYSSVHFVIWLANIKFCFYHRELGKIGRLAQKSSSSSDWRGSCRSLWAGTSGLRRGCRRFFAVFSRSLEINHRASIAPGRPNTTAAAVAPFFLRVSDKKSTFQRDGGIVYSVPLGHDISRPRLWDLQSRRLETPAFGRKGLREGNNMKFCICWIFIQNDF